MVAPVPSILITAYVDALAWKPRDLGFAAIMLKPFDVDDLLETIAGVLPDAPPIRRYA
jgi:hypothetical protein